jgi:hypothetical protein
MTRIVGQVQSGADSEFEMTELGPADLGDQNTPDAVTGPRG